MPRYRPPVQIGCSSSVQLSLQAPMICNLQPKKCILFFSKNSRPTSNGFLNRTCGFFNFKEIKKKINLIIEIWVITEYL